MRRTIRFTCAKFFFVLFFWKTKSTTKKYCFCSILAKPSIQAETNTVIRYIVFRSNFFANTSLFCCLLYNVFDGKAIKKKLGDARKKGKKNESKLHNKLFLTGTKCLKRAFDIKVEITNSAIFNKVELKNRERGKSYTKKHFFFV